jgi:hypothetical protein
MSESASKLAAYLDRGGVPTVDEYGKQMNCWR